MLVQTRFFSSRFIPCVSGTLPSGRKSLATTKFRSMFPTNHFEGGTLDEGHGAGFSKTPLMVVYRLSSRRNHVWSKEPLHLRNVITSLQSSNCNPLPVRASAVQIELFI